MARTRRLAAALVLALGCLSRAEAGTQREEQLADAVRLALAGEIAETRLPSPHFDNPAQLIRHVLWIATESTRLRRKIPDRAAREALLETAWYEARRAGLEPALVLGLIQVESGFNKYAVSRAGAMGLMQVMPFWTHQIGDGNALTLFRMRVNLRYGCVILRHYLDEEHGDLFLALGRYNGSRGRAAYPDAVLAARRAWVINASATRVAIRAP